MPTYTESNRIGDWLKNEFAQTYNREVVTLISGQNLKSGTVLGKITASGKYTLHDVAAVDGSQTAAAVLCFDTDASGGDKSCVAIIRGPVVVAKESLVFKTGIAAADKTAALNKLAELGIVSRTQV